MAATASSVAQPGDIRIDSLIGGTRWGDTGLGTAATITYSFPQLDSAVWNYSNPEEITAGWNGMNATQQSQFTQALATWTAVANINFTLVDDNASGYGDMRAAFTNAASGDTLAWGYFPGTGEESGDIWQAMSVTDFTPGSDGYLTLIHEIGHAIGLKHPFDDAPKLTENETNQYSVMSYTGVTNAGYTFTDLGDGTYNFTHVPPSTPMLYDILAIQYIYGANTTTNSGDTVYQFNNTAELKTIWDTAGNDTIDLSSGNFSFGATVNLEAGSFSSIGQAYRDTNNKDTASPAENNIAIAYNVEIENAVGTALNDSLTGNSLNNMLTGGKGDDTLDGGAGTDTAVFSGNKADYQFTTTSSTVTSVTGSDGTDSLTNIEFLKFDDGSFDLASLLSGTSTTDTTTDTTTGTTTDTETDTSTGTTTDTGIVDTTENAILLLTDTSVPWIIPTGEFAKVYGTSATNNISIDSGARATLSNFSGSNGINFKGNASDYTVSNSGATVSITDSSGNAVTVAATLTAQTIRFADGSADLVISNAIKLGDQTITSNASAISSNLSSETSATYFDTVNADWSANSGNASKLILNDDAKAFNLLWGSKSVVIGSTGANSINLDEGATTTLQNFVGSNQITLNESSDSFFVSNSGATVTLISSLGTSLSLAASLTAQTIKFTDGSTSLAIANGGIFIGDQKIDSNGATVSTSLSPLEMIGQAEQQVDLFTV